MSKQDFDEYYNKIFKQYNQLNENVKELSKQVTENIVEPEKLENMKQTLKPVMESFQTLSYIKYLLDKPKKKKKISVYNKNNVLLKNAKSKVGENILNNNADIIQNIKL